MTHSNQAVATDRLRRALLAFQTAQSLTLSTHSSSKHCRRWR